MPIKDVSALFQVYKVKWPISGHCLARSGLDAPSVKTNEPRALALQLLILLGILFQQEEVGVEDSMLLGSKNYVLIIKQQYGGKLIWPIP